MDFNDIQRRIERLNVSVQSRNDDDIRRFLNAKITEEEHMVSFGTDKDNVIAEQTIIGIIANIAKLKDHFKKRAKDHGQDPSKVENFVSKSKWLCIAIDIDNAEKHGYPLNKPERTGWSPRLADIERSLIMSGFGESGKKSFTYDFATGEFQNEGGHIGISGIVVDRDGLQICHVDPLIENCLKDWELFAKEIGIES